MMPHSSYPQGIIAVKGWLLGAVIQVLAVIARLPLGRANKG